MKKLNLLDCTLRDGGYYNAWDFEIDLVKDYVTAVVASGVTHIEIGFRSLYNNDFKGPFAYSTDEFIKSLNLPSNVTLGIMINASEIIVGEKINIKNLGSLVPNNRHNSPISLIRIACHIHEFNIAVKCSNYLVKKGYDVGINLMQVADRSKHELEDIAKCASKYPIKVLYFADSMGNMDNKKTLSIISTFRKFWKGNLGIHAHDNMGLALSNTLIAIDNGVNWVDSTVTGMGRGAGNTKTELLAIEVAEKNKKEVNILPLLGVIKNFFDILKEKFQWGANPSYYLSGKYGIHPTYIQEMILDKRFNEEDIISSIESLRKNGAKKFSMSQLLSSRDFYNRKPQGKWEPIKKLYNKEIILLAPGESLVRHKIAVEAYIKLKKPIVIALNTNEIIKEELIDYRIACHPLKLTYEHKKYQKKIQPLIAPISMLPKKILESLKNKKTLDYGICVDRNKFKISKTYSILPNSLVITYALAVVFSGKAKRVLLAGFDGYVADDPRRNEVDEVLNMYKNIKNKLEIISITPTSYSVNIKSIYGL